MDIVDCKVVHMSLGQGQITAFENGIITVKFNGGTESRFQYPEAFRKFLRFTNVEAENTVEAALLEIDEKKAQAFSSMVRSSSSKRPTHSKQPTTEKPNIAFKCNFCDGGASKETIGFYGICSDENIHYNIDVKNRTWCSSPDCPCFQYHQGEISREDLEGYAWDDAYTCYESRMLRDWIAMAGIVQNGDRKGQPMRLNGVRPNGLCVLTTREPHSTNEEDRIIFAVFLIDDAYDGDSLDEGYVSGKSKYRLALTPVEAHKMLFWKYHANENNAESPAWNSGLHRYLTDVQAAQILRDIVAVKNGSKDQQLAEEFFREFCKLAKIAPDQLEEPTGVRS